MANSNVALSVVAGFYYDNRGGDILQRSQIFVSGFLDLMKLYRLQSELVIVDWNSSPESPGLGHLLSWPETHPCSSVRIIHVPPKYHYAIENSDQIPFFQFISKNVGIRRSQWDFILATNMDILFSQQLVDFLAHGRLRTKCIYRIDRYDVRADIPIGLSIEKQLEYCRNNILRINARGRTIPVGHGTEIVKKKGKLQRISQRLQALWQNHKFRTQLHTNAAGDFTLMAREDWFALRGYPEFGLRGFKTDALLCQIAHYAGLREVVLPEPMRIYHLEHQARIDGLAVSVADRDERQSPLVLSTERYLAYVSKMRAERRQIIFNDENWGLGNQKLVENIVVKSASTQEL